MKTSDKDFLKLMENFQKQKNALVAKKDLAPKEVEVPTALASLRAKLLAPKEAETTISKTEVNAQVETTTLKIETLTLPEVEEKLNKDEVTYNHLNERQKLAVKLGTSGKSFVLIGSAGSGKTTTQRVILQELARSGKLGKLPTDVNSKHLTSAMPAVLITSFTKVATRNIKEAAPTEFKSNCINIHKAVEFAPTKVMKEYTNEDGFTEFVERQMFVPQKNRFDPLAGIKVCIIEEAGSLDVELFLKLADALPTTCTYIFLGDLNQIPPVYGAAILGFAIDKLPVVELTQVYRQGLGAIKSLATCILDGKKIPNKELLELEKSSTPASRLRLVPMTTRKKNKDEDGIRLNKGIGDFMRNEVLNGNFKAGKSVFLTTVRKDNKSYLNINEINRYIAQTFSELNGRDTYEIRSKSAQGGKFYFSIGDLVFFEREYYKITKIEENKNYINAFGYDFAQPSTTLNRWGYDKFANDHMLSELEASDGFVDSEVAALLEQELTDLSEDKNMVSHYITIETWKSGDEDSELVREIVIRKPGELAALQLGYAQTAHSAQGSEWDDVYCGFPLNVAFMLNREILYTSVTRARTALTIFYEDGTKPHNLLNGTFEAGILRQAIQGDKLSDKVKFFRELGKKEERYKIFPTLLSILNKEGKLKTETYFNLQDDGSLTTRT